MLLIEASLPRYYKACLILLRLLQRIRLQGWTSQQLLRKYPFNPSHNLPKLLLLHLANPSLRLQAPDQLSRLHLLHHAT